VNDYFGQAGFYILNDPVRNAQLQLPEEKYDIPLMLSAKQFQAEGSLFSPATELISLYRDMILVNGQPVNSSVISQVPPRDSPTANLEPCAGLGLILLKFASSQA